MNSVTEMIAALRKMYRVMLAPAAAGVFAIELLRELGPLSGWRLPGGASIELHFFIFTAATALATPMLYRSLFASSHRGKMSIALATLYRYENNSMVIAMMTPWMSLVASIFAFSAFYTIGIFFLGIYACYFYYPSQRKIEADIRIFRVKV
ncbi:MAG: hypothetical protein C0600_01265 [Ignavibacteria bacterium]|nr:MAG: hypothetical protein C0600_01265 [Ignavibacteria bacterium]